MKHILSTAYHVIFHLNVQSIRFEINVEISMNLMLRQDFHSTEQ